MKLPLTSRSIPLVALACGMSLCFSGCREKTGETTTKVETPEAADLTLQLEIEREMLAVERELLDLERVQMEEARNTAVSAADAAKAEADAARAEAEQARQALANGNSVPAPREPAPPLPIQSGERPRTVYTGGSSYPATNYPPVQPSQPNQPYPSQNSDPDYSLFYEELRPHGAWFETPHYGYVWRPEVARRSRDWRPYTEGRWADTDMGWTWISDEPFGWATYHYGRWTIVENLGWIWVPGSDWAPAWVSWRENNDYIGWAPLPPVTLYETRFDYGQRTDTVCGIPAYHYNFIPLIRFVEPVRRYCLPPVQNVQFVQYTTNVTYIHITNQNIIVNGPRPEPLRTRFGRDRMPRLTLNRHGWSPEHRHEMAPRQQGLVLNFTTPRIAAVSTNQERPAHLEGKLDSLIPAHAAAKADGEIVKRFARGRATQEILNSGPILAKDGTINPATQAANPNALPERDVNEIRQTIADRETRIEELTKQREEVIANSVSAPEVTPPDQQIPPPTIGSDVVDSGPKRGPRDRSKDPAKPGLGVTGNTVPGVPDVSVIPTLPEQPVTDLPPTVGGENPNPEALPGTTAGINDVTPETQVGGQPAGINSTEARLQELRKRQEELLARSRNGSNPSGATPNRPDPPTVPEAEGGAGPSMSGNNGSTPSIGSDTQVLPTVPSSPRNPDGRGSFVMPNAENPATVIGQTTGDSDAEARLAEQRANTMAEQSRLRERATAAAAESQIKMQAQIQEAQQRAADEATAATEARNKMLTQPPGAPQVGQPQQPQPVQPQVGQPQWYQAQAAAAAEAQSKAQAQIMERSRAAAEAQSKMQEQLREQQAKAASDAQNRMQAQQQQAHEQARAAAEAQSRMQAQLQEQAQAAAEARSRMQAQQQQMQEQARAAAEAQSRMQVQQLQEQQARAAAQMQENMRAAQEAREAASRAPMPQVPSPEPGASVPGRRIR
ncbi:MAG: DUF6600 domain-containing protein [Verrucomicrobiales bacterium]